MSHNGTGRASVKQRTRDNFKGVSRSSVFLFLFARSCNLSNVRSCLSTVYLRGTVSSCLLYDLYFSRFITYSSLISIVDTRLFFSSSSIPSSLPFLSFSLTFSVAHLQFIQLHTALGASRRLSLNSRCLRTLAQFLSQVYIARRPLTFITSSLSVSQRRLSPTLLTSAHHASVPYRHSRRQTRCGRCYCQRAWMNLRHQQKRPGCRRTPCRSAALGRDGAGGSG